MMYLAANDGSPGGKYPYDNDKEAVENIIFFMETYYPDILKNPNYIPEED